MAASTQTPTSQPYDEESPNPTAFTMAHLAALLDASLAQGYSNNEHQAVARALLRHDMHLDGTHYQTCALGGLHPFFIGFNPTPSPDEVVQSKHKLIEVCLKDLFDAITTQDHLDGGLSLLICCLGSYASQMLMADKITLDVYVTLQELHAEQEQISGDITGMVQVFCTEFALLHLHRFTERCCLEVVKAPSHRCKCFNYKFTSNDVLISYTVFSNLIKATGPHHLPAPLEASVARDFTPILPSLQTPSRTPSGTCHHCPAEAFELEKAKQDTMDASVDGEKFSLPLISIGPDSDTIIDHFGLEDQILLQLHSLLGTVCSSHWEAILKSPEWGLHADQASILADTLLKDIQGSCNYTVAVVKVHGHFIYSWHVPTLTLQKSSSFFRRILQGLGILALVIFLKVTWSVNRQ
ncbi:hypothetical protein PISMIDRAFT_117540 [Pisolithus microcarpus 441]|uniref:Uncharacterized protein n=1 Tax=Pisolithus microcarpus 441 TaxID=765257 RepID=A0A0C9Z2A2_9AGAM|nr:hypothetical protein BKA83DRAFT_117540 [Pisolithus microcarpus]KIK14148.1 hypothetical protein PISMIDRAFT_117540 [Pisolithus microcarpus 441]